MHTYFPILMRLRCRTEPLISEHVGCYTILSLKQNTGFSTTRSTTRSTSCTLKHSIRSAVSSVFTSNSWYRRSSRGSVHSDLLSSFWSHAQVILPEAKLISSHPVKTKPTIFQNKSSDWPDVFIFFHVTTGLSDSIF